MTSRERTIRRIIELDRAIDELSQGAQSATISTNGLQQSYTRPDLAKLIELRKTLAETIVSSSRSKRTQPDFTE